MSYRIQTMPADEAALRADTEPWDGDLWELRELTDAMGRLMDAKQGLGLAAPQVGATARVITLGQVLFENPVHNTWRVMINPEIVWASEEQEEQVEGCLSLPGRFGLVRRPRWCVVEYKNLEWAHCTEEFHGLYARCVQHEIDHLDGRLISDHWLREVIVP